MTIILHAFEGAIHRLNNWIVPQVDPSKVVGSKVYAKAIHVTELAEWHCRYSMRSKKNELPRVFVEVIKYCKRMNILDIFMVIDYDIGEPPNKRKKINICSFLRKLTKSIIDVPIVPVNTIQ